MPESKTKTQRNGLIQCGTEFAAEGKSVRGGSTVLQQNINIGFEQCRTGRAGRVAMNCNGLALQVTNELLSFVLGWKFGCFAKAGDMVWASVYSRKGRLK